MHCLGNTKRYQAPAGLFAVSFEEKSFTCRFQPGDENTVVHTSPQPSCFFSGVVFLALAPTKHQISSHSFLTRLHRNVGSNHNQIFDIGASLADRGWINRLNRSSPQPKRRSRMISGWFATVAAAARFSILKVCS